MLPINRQLYPFSSNTSMFGISIFSTPQHFLALCLGLFTHPKDATSELAIILGRTKSPPISAIYTYELLQDKSWSEYGLDVIRFLSQLSDLSDGASVSSSLQKVIGESSLLTQIRHNLTHKIKISDYLIEISRKIILKELRQKYWDENFRRFIETYHIEMDKLTDQFQRIYQTPLTQDLIQSIEKHKRKLTAEWLMNESSNYEFKQFFQDFYSDHNQKQVFDLINGLNSHKKSISIGFLIRRFCYNNKSDELAQLLIKIFKTQNQNIFSESLVFSSLKKLTFLHYLTNCSKVIAFLPKATIIELGNYWEAKRVQRIYKIFKKEDYLSN